MFQKHITLVFFILISILPFFGQDKGIPESTNRLVNNFSKEFPNFLSAQEEEVLEQKLETFAAGTSNQIVIVIIDDLADYEPWEFATKIGENWESWARKRGQWNRNINKTNWRKGRKKIFHCTRKRIRRSDSRCSM